MAKKKWKYFTIRYTAKVTREATIKGVDAADARRRYETGEEFDRFETEIATDDIEIVSVKEDQ